jgi:hypothetical protein
MVGQPVVELLVELVQQQAAPQALVAVVQVLTLVQPNPVTGELGRLNSLTLRGKHE